MACEFYASGIPFHDDRMWMGSKPWAVCCSGPSPSHLTASLQRFRTSSSVYNLGPLHDISTGVFYDIVDSWRCSNSVATFFRLARCGLEDC